MVIIYLGILTVTFFWFRNFSWIFHSRAKWYLFCYVLFCFALFCFVFLLGLNAWDLINFCIVVKKIFFESRLYFKTSIHHIHSFWIIDFSGRFVLLFMFIFIYTFPSQGSFCVNIGLLFNIRLSYVSIAELVILEYEYRDCWRLK